MWRLRVHLHTRARQIPWDDVLRPGRSLIYSWLYHVVIIGDTYADALQELLKTWSPEPGQSAKPAITGRSAIDKGGAPW